jgi:hypothetical protein
MTLSEKIHKYRDKIKVKEQFADALENEIKAYDDILNDTMELVRRFIPAIERIEEQPTPMQVIDVIDCLSRTPGILARFLISFVGLARACKEISSKKAFMDSLRDSSRFMYDFVNTMSDTYIERDTVKIDGRFFRFYSMYKREILKGQKIGKVKKDELKLIEKRMKTVMHCLNIHFLRRHMRNPTIKKWKSSLVQLGKVSKNVTIEESSAISLDGFIPSELRPLADFLDKSP